MEFLNSQQRRKLNIARDHARDLEVYLFVWWTRAVEEEGRADELLEKDLGRMLSTLTQRQMRRVGTVSRPPESVEDFTRRRDQASEKKRRVLERLRAAGITDADHPRIVAAANRRGLSLGAVAAELGRNGD